MSRKFMIPGLIAAGFGHQDALATTFTRATLSTDRDHSNLFQVFRQEHLYTLAGHRSHSSHSSHASHSSGSGGHSSHFSHTSHYSSTGGYSSPSYQPIYTPPAPPSPSPPPSASGDSGNAQPLVGNANSTATLKPLPGHSALFKMAVQRVQVALMGRGLFNGPINGSVGPSTRAALRAFQQQQGLQVTGTMTPETLDALHVPTP